MDGINWLVELGRILTAQTVGNYRRKPRILATGRYCDETVDGAELLTYQSIFYLVYEKKIRTSFTTMENEI